MCDVRRGMVGWWWLECNGGAKIKSQARSTVSTNRYKSFIHYTQIFEAEPILCYVNVTLVQLGFQYSITSTDRTAILLN